MQKFLHQPKGKSDTVFGIRKKKKKKILHWEYCSELESQFTNNGRLSIGHSSIH